jgi:threonyl-tRNA synthetase
MMDEILNNLDFLDHVYGLFGFRFEMELSTRPAKRLGADALWDKAEEALENALNKFGRPWKLNPGDGAFYGPKIDIKVFDAFKRSHQCGTVQLDFQNPIRFNLQYKTSEIVHAEDNKHEAPVKHVEHLHEGKKTESTKVDKIPAAEGGQRIDPKTGLMSQTFKADDFDCEDFTWLEQHVKPGYKRPVMVHRAILGSVERFMAILIEHTGGKWPFFLSPRQAVICPISEKFMPYCKSVYLYLHK